MAVRVGLIGLGTMGSVHAQAYRQLPSTEIAAVADLRPELRAGFEASGVEIYTTGEELIQSADVDLIDVCVPTPFHRRLVEMAAARGRHVFCEKPLARTEKDAEAMVEACKRAGVKFGVGHVVRFFPEYVQAKNVVESGEIGKPATVWTMRGGGGFPTAWQDWYANFEWSGGLILDMIIHDFDYLRWVFGDVERVFARGTAGKEYNRYEYALVTLRFKSGVIANVEGSWFNHGGFQTKLEIAGQKGLISYESAETYPLKVVLKSTGASAQGVAVPESPLYKSPYLLEIEHFVNCIQQDKEPMISGEEALKSLRIALAALDSIATGKPVFL